MNDVLLAKLLATPIFMVLVTLAGRQFGPGISGWLTGLPLTSGPVSLFLALEQGLPFAQQAAPGSLAGFLAFLAFCGAAAWLSLRTGWIGTIGGGLAAYALVEAMMLQFPHPLWPLVAATSAAVILLLAWLWKDSAPTLMPPPPRWDVWARAATVTAVVIGITAAATWAGPDRAGLLSPIPAFAAVLVGFTHRHAGGLVARAVLRGIVAGALSFIAFFLIIALGATQLGLVVYLLAAVAAMSVNATTVGLVRRRSTQTLE